MDRVNELRCAGGSGAGSGDSTLDTTSPPSEAFMSANDTSSKYFSLSDTTFDINPIKDVSLASTTAETDRTVTDPEDLISNLSPIGKKDMMESYKIGKQIEAANILSGGVDIFDDNENSFEGNKLVIDDNIESDEKCHDKGGDQFKPDESMDQATLVDSELGIPSKDTEVVLQIDGNNVNAIDIGNGLYLYRKHGQEELAAVQIIDDGQEQPSFKFLKVRENSEGNLEVYEEIEIEIPKDMPTKEESGSLEKSGSHVPIKDINKVITDTSNPKVTELIKSPQKAPTSSTSDADAESELKESQNGKMMKFSDSRKSPVVGSFTPMTYHSTPNKEGKPLTKTMVDLQLNPSRHSDNVKKTIEVHTDSVIAKQRPIESQTKKPTSDSVKVQESDEITEPAEKGNIETIDNAVKILQKVQEVSEEKEMKSADEIKSKVMVENKFEISESIKIKQNDTVDEVVIDEDLESNEIGKLVIDENVDEPIKQAETDQIVEKKTDNLSKTPEATYITDAVPAPIAKCTEIIIKEKRLNTEENSKQDEVKLNNEDISGAKDTKQEIENADISMLSPKIADVQKVEKPENTESNTKQLIHVKQTKEILNKDIEVDSQKAESEKEKECKVTKSEKVPKQSITKDSLTDEDKKPILKDTKEVTEKILTAKKEVEDVIMSPPNTSPSTKTSSSKSYVPKTIRDMPPINNEQINKKEDIFPPQNNTAAKLVPKNEVISTIKQVTAVKETIVDKKPSSSELSKAIESKDQKQVIVDKPSTEVKPINNNHNPVPFGKWTDANRQEFLNKFKEHKVPVNTNSKQIKNSNDLNRRDVLKKIDSQRQSNIASSKQDKPNVKSETIFSNKLPPSIPETKIPIKKDGIEVKPKLEPVRNVKKQEIPQKAVASSTVSSSTVTTKVNKKEPIQQCAPATSVAKTEPTPRREVNMNDLINKTIEDMLNKVVPMRVVTDDTKQLIKKDQVTAVEQSSVKNLIINKNKASVDENKILDEIEIKMNELHGIPFVERPLHELPKVQQSDIKIDPDDASKNIKKNDVDSTVMILDNSIDVESEEEVIEHEPITGDIEPKVIPKLHPQEVNFKTDEIKSAAHNDAAKKEPVITEKEFDKFARRNSITYDNCKTVSIETKETHNFAQNIKNKDITLSNNPSKEHFPLEVKLPLKQPLRLNTYSRKPNTSVTEGPNTKNYQSKIHIAYQSALTSKMDRRPVERPITIIEDKPVKVVFMESTAEFVTGQLNVQGQELSPTKKQITEPPKIAATDSLNSGLSEQTEDNKQFDDHKTKTKHQRKQVLTPVDIPELELIQPSDIGVDVSPKKKRKTEDNKNDKHYKTLVHKKSYLLGRSAASEDKINSDISNTSLNEENKIEEVTTINMNTTSALDNLVKAAELIENQSENMRTNITPTSDSSQNTPIKRGRGRPRKTALPEGDDVKLPTSQKKPRLIDAKPVKEDSETDEDSLDGEIIKENWTMGKINENIVCPICNKLFRSENVVFKHVKHCTGVSPNRSDSDKRSPRRDRCSQESDLKSLDSRSDMDIDTEEPDMKIKKKTPNKRKSKEINAKSDDDKTEVIVIEVKKKSDSNDDQQKEKKLIKTKIPPKPNNLVCEFCGKTFRQLSYLVNHKLQHKKDEMIKNEKDKVLDASNKAQVFSCEVCKKEFRKLHHLVQHRFIHNTNPAPPRNLRKASSEHNDTKTVAKDEIVSKHNDDPSAAFRCEPCDKSFRKLHHLVEHRETHDGINKQKVSTSTATAPTLEQSPAPPQCEVCKKTFRKLHHLIEHKEQHLETSSEKSDDKSVNSVLSTKDIIHECSICYMVFPNEQSLNKHSVNCQKKKRQSKTSKNDLSQENAANSDENLKKDDNNMDDNVSRIIAEEVIDDDDVSVKSEEGKQTQHTVDSTNANNEMNTHTNKQHSEIEMKEKSPQRENTEKVEHTKILLTEKPEIPKEKESVLALKEHVTISDNAKKLEDRDVKSQTHNKKRTPVKDKIAPTVTKRRRTVETTMATVNEAKPAVESSDDDEVRYMFNPDFKVDETNEGKVFMEVRANKRNSLQIERPNSKDLVKRKTSLQHPPKIPRLKAKPVETKIVPPGHTNLKPVPKIPKVETATSTDSDDSDVKYSFPKHIPEKAVKPVDEAAKQPGRKSIVDKRKTLSGIAKRKSLGQTVATKNKAKQSPTPVKTVKKRPACVEHRCDCGQLFSSAALLSRHTSLAHTPPRIRRRRSSPPAAPAPRAERPKPAAPAAPAPRAERPKPAAPAAPAPRVERSKPPAAAPGPAPAARKHIRHDAVTAPPPTDTRKSIKAIKTEPKSVQPKVRRSTTAHKGVPVPEKMRKLFQKNKK